METERVELPDGHFWEIKCRVTRGMRKKFKKAQLSSVARLAATEDVDLDDSAAVRRMIAAHPELVELDALEDAYLMFGTEKSSLFGYLTLDILDNLDDRYVEPVLVRMRELYAELDTDAIANLAETPPPSPAAIAEPTAY